jgi:hypothetical protein
MVQKKDPCSRKTLIPSAFKNAKIALPNLFGKGQKASIEYSYGTQNNSDYRFNYQSLFKNDPNKKFGIFIFFRTNLKKWTISFKKYLFKYLVFCFPNDKRIWMEQV